MSISFLISNLGRIIAQGDDHSCDAGFKDIVADGEIAWLTANPHVAAKSACQRLA